MRVKHIRIDNWRHFRGIHLDIPDDASVVCLVGGNGTGKTQIFELIASSAHYIGLSEGFESSRGNPHNENGDFEVTFVIGKNTVPTLDDPSDALPVDLEKPMSEWDRTIAISSTSNSGKKITAGGVYDLTQSTKLAKHLVDMIRTSKSIHYLMLDADRAYPRVQVQTHELGSAFETDWLGNAKSRSYALTKSLYEEWFRYLIGTENRENNSHIEKIRRARDRLHEEPKFIDRMLGYKKSVQEVLPHLLFTGINSQTRNINFDTTGISLTFDQLSGGEREIAFLIGQIERFGLRKGLLLVDEPELHLNYDLLRVWIGFLKRTVDEGQIWLATHALEVVEVAGKQATFLLERDSNTRMVVNAGPIADKPILSTLSRAVGSPAFSISGLTFVLIEGEEEIGERERFRLLTESPSEARFMEAGNCREVMRRLDTLKMLAKASGEPLRIGGIIDGDWRSAGERSEFEALGIHVLQVHEVENFFLHPETVKNLMESISADPSTYEQILTDAADFRAGSFIFDSARTDKRFQDFPPPHADVRQLVHSTRWSCLESDSKVLQEIVDADPNLSDDQRALLLKHLLARAKSYSRVREDGSLWKRCEGKEVFRSIANAIGLSDPVTAEKAILGVWTKRPELRPSELNDLRAYIHSL